MQATDITPKPALVTERSEIRGKDGRLEQCYTDSEVLDFVLGAQELTIPRE